MPKMKRATTTATEGNGLLTKAEREAKKFLKKLSYQLPERKKKTVIVGNQRFEMEYESSEPDSEEEEIRLQKKRNPPRFYPNENRPCSNCHASVTFAYTGNAFWHYERGAPDFDSTEISYWCSHCDDDWFPWRTMQAERNLKHLRQMRKRQKRLPHPLSPIEKLPYSLRVRIFAHVHSFKDMASLRETCRALNEPFHYESPSTYIITEIADRVYQPEVVRLLVSRKMMKLAPHKRRPSDRNIQIGARDIPQLREIASEIRDLRKLVQRTTGPKIDKALFARSIANVLVWDTLLRKDKLLILTNSEILAWWKYKILLETRDQLRVISSQLERGHSFRHTMFGRYRIEVRDQRKRERENHRLRAVFSRNEIRMMRKTVRCLASEFQEHTLPEKEIRRRYYERFREWGSEQPYWGRVYVERDTVDG